MSGSLPVENLIFKMSPPLLKCARFLAEISENVHVFLYIMGALHMDELSAVELILKLHVLFLGCRLNNWERWSQHNQVAD